MSREDEGIYAAQPLYRTTADWVRDSLGHDPQAAERYYQRYIDFVAASLPGRGSRILDVGCGYGWSTSLLRRRGHDAVGLDLHPGPVEKGETASLSYVTGDMRRLPFKDRSFDAVACHDVLEHVPEPEAALLESLRVLRPGGRLIVTGPNLLSFLMGLIFALGHTARVLKAGKVWERRTPDLADHPWGNTMPEAWSATAHHLFETARKLAGESPVRFLMRTPDRRPPFESDNDACYLLNPMDLVNWARGRADVRLVRWWAPHHAAGRWLWWLRAGTWVVMEKRA